MARTTGSNGVRTMEMVRRAGIKRIHQHGYEAMKLRDLAADVGIRAGSLYNYIQQKEDFLYSLLLEIMTELHEELRERLKGAETPLEALERFVDFHLRWHMARREEVFIGNMELRSLTARHYRWVVGLRSGYERRLQEIIEAGNVQGTWKVRDPKVTTYAILAMLTGVCTWYKPRGRLSQDELVVLYRELVLGMVGVRGANSSKAKRDRRLRMLEST